MSVRERAGRCRHKGDCYYEFLHLIFPFLFCLKLVCRRTDQPADNSSDGRRAKRDPSGIPAVMMGVVHDMMPRRRRRRTMRTMPPPMTRRSNRRASRQRQSREKNRNRFNGLVHVTPTFPDFCPYTKQGNIIAKT